MKKLGLITGLVLATLLVSIACAEAPEYSVRPVPTPTPAPMPAEKEGVYGVSQSAGALSSTSEERMIVRTGEMSLVVDDVAETRDEIVRLAAGFDGYVVSSRIWGEEQDIRGRVSIRVPDERFDASLTELRKLAVRVAEESTSSRDITEEYVDLKSRLSNAEATESQYLALLEKAEKVEDILSIYERLSRVRSEIEQLKGRMQYLERTSSMSLISVNLEPVGTAKPLVRAGWSILEALNSAVRGLVTFGQWLGTTLIWLLIFCPLWGAILGIIFWRRRKKKAAR